MSGTARWELAARRAQGKERVSCQLRTAQDIIARMADPVPTRTLFDRMGGRPALARLLRQFYADVRQHDVIGPIFRARIHDWPSHLEKIADFWSGATGGPATYSGPMPQRHFPLGLEAEHFEAWLDLWRRNCRIQIVGPEAEELIRIAENIGERLRMLVAMDAGRKPDAGGR